jgi:hypothetical protein
MPIKRRTMNVSEDGIIAIKPNLVKKGNCDINRYGIIIEGLD